MLTLAVLTYLVVVIAWALYIARQDRSTNYAFYFGLAILHSFFGPLWLLLVYIPAHIAVAKEKS